jgi:MOSC domain-containing protein YiiM
MLIKSLNIGRPKPELFQGKEFLTGMCKQPVSGAVFLSKQGFEGDGVGDPRHHGGEDKAVCVYSIDHYPYWGATLNITMPSAAFGENLSVEGLREGDVCIGDVYRIGTAVVQVSQPRQPCGTLAARYGRNDLVTFVVDSGRTGFYFRVIGRIVTASRRSWPFLRFPGRGKGPSGSCSTSSDVFFLSACRSKQLEIPNTL